VVVITRTDEARPGGAPPARTPRRRRLAALGASLCACAAVMGAGAGTAGAVTPIRSDLDFILEQIRRAEAHAAGGELRGPGPNQVAHPLHPYGLRTVDGEYNNLEPGQERYGAADSAFPRLLPSFFRQADVWDPDGPGGAPGTPTSYTQKRGVVADSSPRVASNLVVDQTNANPAAVAAAGDTPGAELQGEDWFIPNQAPDEGLSAPYNSWFTLFGQFFDHGLDLTTKGGSGTVIVPLRQDDPLYQAGSPTNFMVLTRATNQPGPDGVTGDNPATPGVDESLDDIKEHTNTTTSFVDQNQTYTSHPSHQVFLREYGFGGNGRPVATGRLVERVAAGGLATWTDVKDQARAMLGIELDDRDVLNVPLVLTDQYGRFIPDPDTGYAQVVTDADPLTLESGTPAAPVDGSTAVRTGHAFLDDIAHHAAPVGDHDRNPSSPPQALAADDDPGTSDDGLAATYDDELLAAHFITGDGRGNENIGLTAVHHVFHAEHNLRVDDVKQLVLEQEPAFVDEWQLADGAWDGERLFQAARFITEMEYQHLVFEEFARKVQPQVNLFAGYQTEIDPAIVAEFAHTVYRFGHSMLTETVARRTTAGTTNDIGLIEAFLNPLAFNDDGNGGRLSPEAAAGSIARGMTSQVGNEIDEFVTGALRNNLVGLPLDLATINIARGREAGVPSLNAARRAFFAESSHSALEPYESWADFGLGIRHPASLVNFVAAYGTHPSVAGVTAVADKRAAATLLVEGGAGAPADRLDFMNGTGDWASAANGVTITGVDAIDFWLGGLAEKQMPFGGLLGSTFNYVFEVQMEKLQDGDRFYYLSRNVGLNFLTQLEESSFAELVMRTTDTTHLPFDIFSTPNYTFEMTGIGTSGPIQDDPTTPYDESALLVRMANGTVRFAGGEHVVMGGTDAVDRMRAGEGDDTLWGDGGADRLEGDAGNDALNGGDGDDILTDLFGDDNIKGGEGDDAINAGSGFDLILGGFGSDFIVAGADPKETFAGGGDDFVIAGDSSDTVFGNEGSDWIEGGNQADLLQGENGDPFQENTNPGHDVIIGDGGNDDYDAEGGNDVMVAGPGVERNEGMLGFDWVTHKGDPQAADADMNFTGLLPPVLEDLRDRFDVVEGLSGWNRNDILRGDDSDATTLVGNELTDVGLVDGLEGVLGTGVTQFSAGNIILGGLGSDIVEGRGGDDILDGDAWLNVRLSVRDANDPGVELRTADSMRALQADVFAGRIDPGQIRIVREVLTPAPGEADIDTAVYSDVRASYDVTRIGPGVVRVVHARGTAVDGTDTVRNVERLAFADETVETVSIISNTPATGTVTIDDTTPTEDQTLTAARQFDDPDGVDAATIAFDWQIELAPNTWVSVESDATFDVPDEAVGTRIRVVATFLDGAGVLETVTSDPTAVVGNVNDAPTGVPVLDDPTPQQGAPVAAAVGNIADLDGLVGVTFAYQWQQRLGNGAFTDIAGATASTFTPTAAQVGRSLRVLVRFTDNRGTAEQVASVATGVVIGLPGPPTIGNATAGPGSATVRWTAPAANGGSPVTGYQVRVLNAANAQVGALRAAGAGATSLVVAGLTGGTSYRFEVMAVNAVGAGPPSARSNAVVAGAVATVPGAPGIGNATQGAAGGARTAIARWTAPVSSGGSAITGYRVTALRMSSGAANATVLSRTTSALTAPGARQLQMTLPAGTYRFEVVAVNAIGTGAASPRSNAVVPR
jgi:hypothetical protein